MSNSSPSETIAQLQEMLQHDERRLLVVKGLQDQVRTLITQHESKKIQGEFSSHVRSLVKLYSTVADMGKPYVSDAVQFLYATNRFPALPKTTEFLADTYMRYLGQVGNCFIHAMAQENESESTENLVRALEILNKLVETEKSMMATDKELLDRLKLAA